MTAGLDPALRRGAWERPFSCFPCGAPCALPQGVRARPAGPSDAPMARHGLRRGRLTPRGAIPPRNIPLCQRSKFCLAAALVHLDVVAGGDLPPQGTSERDGLTG